MTRAVLIHTADGPGVIVVEERNVRKPRIGEVLIRIHAAAFWTGVGGASTV